MKPLMILQDFKPTFTQPCPCLLTRLASSMEQQSTDVSVVHAAVSSMWGIHVLFAVIALRRSYQECTSVIGNCTRQPFMSQKGLKWVSIC